MASSGTIRDCMLLVRKSLLKVDKRQLYFIFPSNSWPTAKFSIDQPPSVKSLQAMSVLSLVCVCLFVFFVSTSLFLPVELLM